jgi:hypothetical protein
MMLAGAVLAIATASAVAEDPRGNATTPLESLDKEERHVFVVDGSFVHDVGELQLNMTNWGLIGSKPLVDAPYSKAPSAMWPAGSGVDYLFAAGLWVGGVKNGVPLVSTGQYETELLPTADPLDTMYRMRFGDPGGTRYPYPGEDDDGDGRVNEDVKDGYDNDGDGLIDEDFAIIGDQQFRWRMRDDLPVISELFPDHDPLDIEVEQESYQWDNPLLDDAVVIDTRIRNVGHSVIEGFTLGLFADPDIGSREGIQISEDDMVGFYEGTRVGEDGGLVSISMAYAYDCDGDNGQARGYIGFMFVDRSVTSFRTFVGTSSFDRGGDPNTDSDRYASMTEGRQSAPAGCEQAGDYRLVIATQPVFELRPGQQVDVPIAIVLGKNLDDLVHNAGQVVVAGYGRWYDRDGDRNTGIRGRETKVCESSFGISGPNNPIFDLSIDCAHAYPAGTLPPKITPDDLDGDGCVWINGDCSFEARRGAGDDRCRLEVQIPSDFYLGGCTGIRGREYHVPWITDAPPPIPEMRIREADQRIQIFWNSRPEEETDLATGKPLFESYRIWRADDWERPLGSSIEHGPGSKQWERIAEFDVVDWFESRNGSSSETLTLGANTGLDAVAYTPAVLRPESPESREFAELAHLVDRIVTENPSLDPDVPIRFTDARGMVTPLGMQYPELAAWECCTAQLDTLAWDRLGRRFYSYEDRHVHDGLFYFYSVTATTVAYDEDGVPIGYGPAGRPLGNFAFGVPQSPAQTAEERDRRGQNIYVVPNPATREALADFSQLHPNQEDPTGVRVEFRNLPRARDVVRIFTLAGDLIETIEHDGRDGSGSASWNLVTRNGQEVVSGIYLYSVESDDPRFDRVVGRFVIVR